MNPRALPDRCNLYAGDLQNLAHWVRDSPDKETGGDLFGNWSHVGNPVVQAVIGPGPQARRSATLFHQDIDFLRAQAALLARQGGLQHIGQWHSHHRLGLEEPSEHDNRTIQRALANYHLPAFVLCIATLREIPEAPQKPAEVHLHPFLYRAENPRPCPLAVVVVPGCSPFAPVLQTSAEPPAQPPLTLEAVKMNTIAWDAPARSAKPVWPGKSFPNRPEGREFLRQLSNSFPRNGWTLEMRTEAAGGIWLHFSHPAEPHQTCYLPPDYPDRKLQWSPQPEATACLKQILPAFPASESSKSGFRQHGMR
jgi:hypothetical protein